MVGAPTGPSPRLEALLAVLAPAQVVDTLDQETQGGDRETHGDHHGRDLVLRREQELGVTVSWGCEESTDLSFCGEICCSLWKEGQCEEDPFD